MSTTHETGFGFGVMVPTGEVHRFLTDEIKDGLSEAGMVTDELPELLGFELVAGSGAGNFYRNDRYYFFGVKSSMVTEYDYLTPAIELVLPSSKELEELTSFLSVLALDDEPGWRAWHYEG